VDVIPVSGAAEVAPRLGLAEAIVDLVSTGSTMVVNGLRPIEEVFESEAVLLANAGALQQDGAVLAQVETMLSATLAARDRKYLMMNAPEAKLAELEDLLPGWSRRLSFRWRTRAWSQSTPSSKPMRSGRCCPNSRPRVPRASSFCRSRSSSHERPQSSSFAAWSWPVPAPIFPSLSRSKR